TDSKDNSSLDSESSQISLYNANYHNSGTGLYNKNIVSLVLNNNSLRRVVADGGVNIVDANASYNSSQYSFASSFGYLSNIGDDIVFGPEFTIGYSYFPKYNYTEEGDGALNIGVRGDRHDNVFTELSLRLSGTHKERKEENKKYKKNKKVTTILGGYVKGGLTPKSIYSLKPSISLSWLKNHRNKARDHQIKFINLSNAGVATSSSDNLLTDIYGADIGLEILEIKSGSTFGLSYRLDSGDDFVGHSVYLKYVSSF
ncbi:MAG: hypothetical protein ACI9W5_000895, partial [Ulvibacter sp.]